MNWLDIILVLWLLSSVISGFRMGFIYKLGTLAGLIVGLWVSSRYTPSVAEWLGGGAWTTISAFLFLLSLTSKLFGIVAWAVDKLFSIVRIIPFVTTMNRAAGAVLSVIVTAFFLSSCLFVLQSLPRTTSLQSSIAESSVARGLEKLSVFYTPLLSEKLKQYVEP